MLEPRGMIWKKVKTCWVEHIEDKVMMGSTKVDMLADVDSFVIISIGHMLILFIAIFM